MLLLKFKPFERILSLIGEYYFIRRSQIEKLLSSAYGISPNTSQVAEYYKTLKIPGTATGFIRAFTKSKVLNNLDGTKFSAKSLTIVGEKDNWIPPDNTIQFLSKFNNAEIISITNAVHCPHETHYIEVNKIIKNFLEN